MFPVENTDWALDRQDITEITSLEEGEHHKMWKDSHLALGFRCPLDSGQGCCVSYGRFALPSGICWTQVPQTVSDGPGGLQGRADSEDCPGIG